MKVSYNWLKTYFAEGDMPSVEDIVEKFTFRIFEVDGVEEVNGDTVIELDVLPNRAHDCLGHRGVAHEVAALFNIKMLSDPLREDAILEPVTDELVLNIESTEVNPVHALALIKGVKVGESPKWLKERLEAIGQKSINNVVDATNYVMFGLGQPSHVFDASKLKVQDGAVGIHVRSAVDGEVLTLLGGKEAILTAGMSVLADVHNDAPLDVAGVKGGVHAELDESTTDVVVTCAKFHPIITRKTSQKLKIRTDAVQRYENEIANKLPIIGMKAVTDIILEVAGGELQGFLHEGNTESTNKPITMTATDVKDLLGITIASDEIAKIFTRLEFEYIQDGESFSVVAPWERMDINITEDLVEEVGRVYGYENIPDAPLPDNGTVLVNKKYYYIDALRTLLNRHNFTEVYLYPLRAEGELKLSNSLAADKDHYRVNLSDGIGEALVKNSKNAPLLGIYDAIKLFEVGDIYKDDKEVTHIAFGTHVFGKKKREERTADALALIIKEMEVLLDAKLPEAINGIVEFDIDGLLANLPEPSEYVDSQVAALGTLYTPSSSYPFINRDIAMWAPGGVSEELITKVIEKHGGELVVRIDKFDEFAKGGRVSLAFHIIFQSMEKTLTDDEVGNIMKKIEAELGSMEGFEVR